MIKYSSPKKDRAKNDLYETPYSLTRAILNKIKLKKQTIHEPACGRGAVTKVLKNFGYNVIQSDITTGTDFLKCNSEKPVIITNPPFCLWDDFVLHAKTVSKKFIFLGKLNYLGTASRYKLNLWENLRAVYPLNRCIDFRHPLREDGKFYAGALYVGWFYYDMSFYGDPTIHVLDISIDSVRKLTLS